MSRRDLKGSRTLTCFSSLRWPREHLQCSMHWYIKRMGQLGFVMDHELRIDLIMSGLSNSCAQFVLNYRMNNIETSVPELINMLKVVEPFFEEAG